MYACIQNFGFFCRDQTEYGIRLSDRYRMVAVGIIGRDKNTFRPTAQCKGRHGSSPSETYSAPAECFLKCDKFRDGSIDFGRIPLNRLDRGGAVTVYRRHFNGL